MTDLIAQPVLTVEIEPAAPITVALENAQAEDLIAEHEQKIDPHAQYATDTDLSAHSTNASAHVPAGGLTNAQIATNAAIDWAKVSKSGAAAIDVGAASILHEVDAVIHIPAGGISNNQIAAGAAIDWAKISKAGAVPSEIGAMPALGTIDQQVGSVKPTVRSTGAALQVGDRWLDTGDRIWWYWDGTYWLSETLYRSETPIASQASSGTMGILCPPSNTNLYLISVRCQLRRAAPQNTTDYWTITINRHTDISLLFADIFTTTLTTTLSSGNDSQFVSGSLNLHQDISALSLGGYRIFLTRNGVAGALGHSVFSIRYRLAKP